MACHSLIDYPVGVGFIARGCPGGLDNYCPKREKDSIVLTWLGGVKQMQYLFLPEYDDIYFFTKYTSPTVQQNKREVIYIFTNFLL